MAKSQQLPSIIEDKEDIIHQDKLGHRSPKKIKIMAQIGILPKQLANCQIPSCTTCLFGKATKKAL
jgi:hypothetical protein